VLNLIQSHQSGRRRNKSDELLSISISNRDHDDEKSTTKFWDYIIKDVMNEQTTNKQSTLFLALRVYYDESVSLLLKKSNVRVNDNVKSTALEKIAEHGLLKGAEVIQPKTTRNL